MLSKKRNAEWHLNYVCPLCSKWRKKFRDPKRIGDFCLWNNVWEKKKYDFPRNFGIINWIKYYFGLKTDLKKYLTLRKKEKK